MMWVVELFGPLSRNAIQITLAFVCDMPKYVGRGR